MSYVDLPTFKEYARSVVGNANDDLMTAALLSASNMCDTYCQRSFTVAGAATSRVFTPRGPWLYLLRLPDFTTVTSVTDNGTAVAAADYQLEPLNGSPWNGAARPYEDIRRFDNTWTYDMGRALVTIVAAWGWLETPAAVTDATLIIAKDILQQRNNNSGVAGFGEYGAVRARMNPIAADLLNPYRRLETIGVV